MNSSSLKGKFILISILLIVFISGCCNLPPIFFGKGEFVLNTTPKFYGKQDYNSCTPKPTNFTTDVIIPQELASKIEAGKEYIVIISGCDNKIVKITTDEREAYSWSNYTVNGCEKECGEFNVSASFNASKLIATAIINSKKDANFSVLMYTGGPCRRMTLEEENSLEKNGTHIIGNADLGRCPSTCNPYLYNSSINLKAGESKNFEFVSNCINQDSGTYLLLSYFSCNYLENDLTHLGNEDISTEIFR